MQMIYKQTKLSHYAHEQMSVIKHIMQNMIIFQ